MDVLLRVLTYLPHECSYDVCPPSKTEQGITYSVMSASWDDDREGSGLGVDEFQKNVGNLKEGLARTKENALLRERMAGLSEDEIQRAIDDQERREKAKNKKDAWME